MFFNYKIYIKVSIALLEEGSYFDRINMTKNWLEYDQKISQRQTLLFEYDRKMFTMKTLFFEFDRNS